MEFLKLNNLIIYEPDCDNEFEIYNSLSEATEFISINDAKSIINFLQSSIDKFESKPKFESLIEEIKAGKNEQFIYNTDSERVQCKCGHNAIWWQRDYLCGTITAYPCKYNIK